uniref:Transmembrane protein 80 n=2 Tax=Macrostomum lignano TaxID=282301 RepID=A0A1I8JKV6_9PLAT
MSGDQKPLTGATATGATPVGATTRGGSGLTLRSKDDARSLAVLEVLLYFNKFYIALFWLCQILMFIYKGENLPYATGILAGEVILQFALTAVDLLRVYLFSYGNLAGSRVAAILGIILTFLAILGVIYLLLFQTYTLRPELITCSLALVFYLLGVILAIGALIYMT